MLTLDRVCTITPPGGIPEYCPYGYVISEDGTIYALQYQFYHGVVLAILYPEVLKAYKPEQPEQVLIGDEWTDVDYLAMPEEREDINVFSFQRFELSTHGSLPTIRVCSEQFIGGASVDLPKGKATGAQVESLQRVLMMALELTPNAKIQMDYYETTVKNCLLLAAHTQDDRFAVMFPARGE